MNTGPSLTAKVKDLIIDGEQRTVKCGDTAIIKKIQLHTLKATTRLTIIEVQIDDILSEDDIEHI